MFYSFLKKASYFVLPMIICFLIIELPMHYWFKSKIGKPAEFQQTLSKADEIELLLIGDSHFAYLKPNEFDDKTELFWNGALDLYNSYHIIKKVSDKSPKLKNVVLNLSFFSFANSNAVHNTKTINDYFLMGILPERYVDIRNLSTLYSKYGQAYNIVTSRLLPQTSKTNTVNLGKKVTTKEDLRKHAKFKGYEHGKTVKYAKNNPNVYKTNLSYFSKIVSLCSEKNIKLTVIVTPHSKYYFEEYPYIKDFYTNLEKVKSPNFEFYDFSRLYYDNDEKFRDSDHMSVEASLEFSKLLNQKIRIGE